MKNKAQSGLGIALIVAIMIFMVGVISVNFVRDAVTSARSDLVCTGTISDGTKLACLLVDVVVPYFIVMVLSAAGGLITAKLLL